MGGRIVLFERRLPDRLAVRAEGLLQAVRKSVLRLIIVATSQNSPQARRLHS